MITAARESELVAVTEIGPCPLCGEQTVRNDRGGTTCVGCATRLPFEREGFGVNKPGAWRRLYTTMQGYCREFGWRACFLGGGE